MTATAWILTEGMYSSYRVVGVFATEAQAVAIRDALGDDDYFSGGYMIEERDVLPNDLRVDTLWTTLSWHFGIWWNGDVVNDTSKARRADLQPAEPFTLRRLVGVPGDDRPLPETPPACEVRTHAFESSYTLGVNLSVTGTDLERVRKVFSEQRAMLVADPATATVRAWVDRAREHGVHGGVPSWVWTRAENAGLVDALRRAGLS